MFFLYQIIVTIILLFSPIILIFRLIKKKEDLKRFKEKFCFFSKQLKTSPNYSSKSINLGHPKEKIYLTDRGPRFN